MERYADHQASLSLSRLDGFLLDYSCCTIAREMSVRWSCVSDR